jgi:hypothetical protein
MSRFEVAEKLLSEIDELPLNEQSPERFMIVSAVAAALEDDDTPQIAAVAYRPRGEREVSDPRLIRNARGDVWILYRTDVNGSRIPEIRLLTPSADAVLTYTVTLKPMLAVAHPDGWSITFEWKHLNDFEEGEHGWVRDALRSLVLDPRR